MGLTSETGINPSDTLRLKEFSFNVRRRDDLGPPILSIELPTCDNVGRPEEL